MKSLAGLGHEGHAAVSIRKYLWRRKAELVLKLLTSHVCFIAALGFALNLHSVAPSLFVYIVFSNP